MVVELYYYWLILPQDILEILDCYTLWGKN